MIMKKNILLRTNLLVCAVIVLGFAISSVISYWSNQGIFLKDVENVSSLTSEGIYYQIESIFTRPVNVSLTMANDNLLKEFLADEEANLRNPSYVETLRDYLNVYRAKYGYDSVFLVSTRTGRYYHFNGLDRVLTPGNLENEWYYAFLKSGAEHSLNIDNDEAARNEITVFINCRITGRDGSTRGVVGVGFRLDHLQALLDDYEKKFGVAAYLVGEDGNVEVSTERTGYKAVNLFRTPAFAALKARILNDSDGRQMFWYPAEGGDRYLVTQYLPNLHWHLVVENDTRGLTRKLNVQFYRNVLVIVVILVCVLLTITRVIRSYNAQIIRLTRAVEERERKHRAVFQEATEQLYENIYELDITHNRTASEATERYFESLGAALGTPYDECLRIVAGKQIKEEFRQGYLDTFSRENVLRAYREGRNSLQYDLMISSDGGESLTGQYGFTHIFHRRGRFIPHALFTAVNIDACSGAPAVPVRSGCGATLTASSQGRYAKTSGAVAANPGGRSPSFWTWDVLPTPPDTLGHAREDTPCWWSSPGRPVGAVPGGRRVASAGRVQSLLPPAWTEARGARGDNRCGCLSAATCVVMSAGLQSSLALHWRRCRPSRTELRRLYRNA